MSSSTDSSFWNEQASESVRVEVLDHDAEDLGRGQRLGIGVADEGAEVGLHRPDSIS